MFLRIYHNVTETFCGFPCKRSINFPHFIFNSEHCIGVTAQSDGKTDRQTKLHKHLQIFWKLLIKISLLIFTIKHFFTDNLFRKI